MTTLQNSKAVSLLNLILPKESLVKVSSALTKAGAKGIFQISARGSILNEGGFLQKMFPPPAPEQILIQALVPNPIIDTVVDASVRAGNLEKVGAGAVFTIDCNDAHIASKFPTEIGEGNDTASDGKVEMEAICCICEKGIADDIAKAALQNGAPGPTVTFGEGGGVRDKIPLLRITKGRKRIRLVRCRKIRSR